MSDIETHHHHRSRSPRARRCARPASLRGIGAPHIKVCLSAYSTGGNLPDSYARVNAYKYGGVGYVLYAGECRTFLYPSTVRIHTPGSAGNRWRYAEGNKYGACHAPATINPRDTARYIMVKMYDETDC